MLSFRNAIVKSLGSLAVATIAFAAPAAAHPTIDIVASNWHFTPSTITVQAGEATTLRLTSASGTHGIASDELGIAATTISQGRFVEVTFTPRSAGTFAVHCSVYCGAGHADMVLTVVVKAASGATPAPTVIPQPAAPPTPMPMPTTAPPPKATPKPAIDDRHFIILMVGHDRMGLQMAQLAVKRSHRAQVVTMFKSVVARDTTAISQLQRWYKTWYGTSVPAMPGMGSMAMPAMGSMAMPFADMMRSTSLASLAGAPDFDRALLIDAMHHDSMGASMSLLAEQGLTHADLRRSARSAAAAQLNDVQQLWRWFNVWYPEK